MSAPVDMPPPTRSLLIASAPRTGSQLLSETLYATGLVGDPREFLQPRRFEAVRTATGIGYPAFRDRALTLATGDHGVRSVTTKINALRWILAMERASDPTASQADDVAVLDRLFPAPTWVFLRREDTARQAISWYRALASETWLRRTGDEASPGPVAEPVWSRLAWLEERARSHTERWRAWFARCRITPIEITYEALVSDLPGVVRQILGAVGLAVPAPVETTEPGLERMADEQSEEWLERYLAIRDTVVASPLVAADR